MEVPRKRNKKKGQDVGVFEFPLGVGGNNEGELAYYSATVDTGAIHSKLPESLLRRINVVPIERFSYTLADGSEVNYDFGMALLGLAGHTARYCPVIFGPEDQHLVGATTLEFFNLMVDPVDGVLVRRVPRARPL